MFGSELISIIVPVYNTAMFLPKALQSLQVQTYQNIEIILVDDGSTDNSGEICRAFAEQDRRFRYLKQPNGGVSRARNTGLGAASGEYIAFMDSDDWVEPDYIQSMYDMLKTHHADVSIVSFYGKKRENKQETVAIYSAEEALVQMYAGKQFEGSMCAKLFKESLFDGIWFPEDIRIGEDMIVAAKAFCNATVVAFRDVPKYHYYFNPASATKTKWNPKFWACTETAVQLYSIMKENYPQWTVYGRKVACYWNLAIAQKLTGCDQLTKTDYHVIRNNILEYYDREVDPVLGMRLKWELKIFLLSRSLYILLRKIFKSGVVLGLRHCWQIVRS